jgi:hypothetical protein
LYRGGLRRNWGGPLNFLKPEKGGFEKIQRDERRGGFENIYQFEKTLVVLKMYHKAT